MSISTHALDISAGRPAEGIRVTLEFLASDGEWGIVGSGITDPDGRVAALLPKGPETAVGRYRLIFETGDYFEGSGLSSFHPRVQIEFVVHDGSEHYHVPLLLSRFGYTTYRGS